jgi:hypothetical protein
MTVGWDSSIDIAISHKLHDLGIESRRGKFIVLVHFGLGAHPVSCTNVTESFSGLKRTGRGVHYTPHTAPTSQKGYSFTAITPSLDLQGLL